MAAGPLSLVESCLHKLQHTEESTDSGDSFTLSDTCPELSLALDSTALAHLEPALEDKTTLGQLRDVQRSLRSLQSAPKEQHAPALNNLLGILKQTYTPEKKSKPLENPVDKLLEWAGKKLREYFKKDNWITRHFHIDNKISKTTLKGMLNVGILILVIIVLFIIVNEMRAAGIFSLFRYRRGVRQHQHDLNQQKQDLSWVNLGDISALPLHVQIPALLSYTLQKLIDRKVLPGRYNLTNQEFLNILRRKLPEAAQDFEQLVNNSERVVYGNKSVSDSDAHQLLEGVRHIEQLQGKVKQ